MIGNSVTICPTDALLWQWATQQLDDEAIAAIDEHLEQGSGCDCANKALRLLLGARIERVNFSPTEET
jgi:hypothetical protein